MVLTLRMRDDIRAAVASCVDLLAALQRGRWSRLAEEVRAGLVPLHTGSDSASVASAKQNSAADWIEVAGDVCGRALADPRGEQVSGRLMSALRGADEDVAVDDVTVKELLKALDLDVRLRLGQLETVMDILTWDQGGMPDKPESAKRYSAGVSMLRAAKGELGFLPAASLGIRNPRVDQSAQVSLMLYRCLKQVMDDPQASQSAANGLFEVCAGESHAKPVVQREDAPCMSF